MRHDPIVFGDVIKFIPWRQFDRSVDKHRADHRVRRLRSRDQLLAQIYTQISGAVSLRETEAGLESHKARLYHCGARCAARSTLADANAKRPWQVFADLFAYMAGEASRATRRRMRDAVRLIDATRIKLSSLSADWAQFSGDHSAVKLHLVFDPNGANPVAAAVSPEKVNDIVEGRQFKIEPGATYVFDLAYYDFAWWAKLHDAGCTFVTRLKSNTRLRDMEEIPLVPEAENILSDRTGLLPKRLKSCGENPMTARVRELEVQISTGKIIRILSNDLEAPAAEIAALYKQRWEIELFFKWLKQNLKVKRFLGTSENAVRIQLFCALITFLLLRLAHQAQSAVPKFITFTCLVRLNLMHRKPLNALHKPPPPLSQSPQQAQLCFNES